METASDRQQKKLIQMEILLHELLTTTTTKKLLNIKRATQVLSLSFYISEKREYARESKRCISWKKKSLRHGLQ